ncbi:DegV family protein [Irregularibacter muris]|uniref:DegV family protein n=1 Tax=Irregularibacter muris TaxID=1796619 RepID=A0AAE3HG67_9FIRM|nr:DegV family protein [Irregularibacter muris]MCR1898513.1 DegV family protein [Irregularibacter muris]
MSFKLLADSCCDLNGELEKKLNIDLIPLTIRVGDHKLVDDKSLDSMELVKLMKDSPTAPQTSCPSPGDYMERFKRAEADNIFVVTLSSALSGSYNSAMLAKKMFLEQIGDKFIHVFDSLSASIAETLISMKLQELIDGNLEKESIVEKANHYISELKTFFILESLDNLVKAGRLSKLKGKIASALNIKPIMGEDGHGNIKEVEKVRSSKKAFRRLVEIIGDQGEKFEDKILGIAHCNAFEKAKELKEEILKRYDFKDIIIVETAGISTVYANDGGVIIAF